MTFQRQLFFAAKIETLDLFVAAKKELQLESERKY
jgi:hypothetical protein